MNKVHRDISYTNILLRSPGANSFGKTMVREMFTKAFDLSNIENLRKQINCWEGLLIDYDYATVIAKLAMEGASKETIVVEEESGDREVIEGSRDEEDDEEGEDSQNKLNVLDHDQKPSGGQTVSLFFDTCLYLLRHFAGYPSIHRYRVTSL